MARQERSTAAQATDAGRRQAALLRLSTEITAADTEVEICGAVAHGLHDEALGYDFVAVVSESRHHVIVWVASDTPDKREVDTFDAAAGVYQASSAALGLNRGTEVSAVRPGAA